MFFGLNLTEIFLFPVKDAQARKHFLIGSAIAMLAFVIPILPYFVLTGYALQIARQIFKDELPRMIAWDNWGELTLDGAKMLGLRLAYSLPILIVTIPLMLASFAMPFFPTNSPDGDAFFFIFMAIIFAGICILIPISIPLAVIVPAAEMHALSKNEFSAGFRYREWFPILRANLGGFIAAFGIYYLSTLALTFIIQILMATIILACLLPILMPAVTFYLVLIMYASIAQAYKDGASKQPESAL